MNTKALWLWVAAMAAGAGCYHAEPLDVRTLLTELRRGDLLPPEPAGQPVVGALTEERSIAIAMLWNRELRAMRLTRGVAAGEVATAGELSNPILRTDLTHLQGTPGQGLGWDLRLSWTPPQPGVREGRRGAARARVDEVDRQVSEREWALSCDVRAAHAVLLAYDEEIRVAETTVTNRRKLVELVTKRVAQGGTTRFDLDLIRLSLAKAEREQGERRLARTYAASALVQLLGAGPPKGEVVVAGTLGDETVDAPLPAQAELEDRALADRPALAAARSRYQESEEVLRAETAARWPWLTLSAIPRIRRNEFSGATTDIAVGVDFTLPVFNTNEGRVQSATAAREAARADVLSTIGNLRGEIARARATIETQRSVLLRVHADIEPLLSEHDRLLALAAQAAELDLPALIAAEDLVLAARTELIEARLELRKAHIAMERAVGTHLSSPSR